MLFVLWLTGLVVVSIELFGPSGSISGNCDLEVFSRNPKGQTLEVLAYLQQKNICESWRLVFAMALIGAVFFLWIMIMAYKVFVDS
jgi:RsiW-degrading membrane proteinase PrsW (M82 family)